MKMRNTIIFLFVLGLLLAACGGQSAQVAAPQAPETSAALPDLGLEIDVQTAYAIQNNPDVYMLDVREQNEFDEKHIPNINLLPMSELQSRLDEIPTDKEVIVTCRSGNRSEQVTQFLTQNGFDNVHNMQGGIVAWEQAGFPVEN